MEKFEYKYERQNNFTEPQSIPLIRIFESFGELKDINLDENWKKHKLYAVYNRIQPYLSALMARAHKTKDLELNDYTESARENRRREFLREPYTEALKIISEERQAVKQNVQNMQLRILSQSNPAKPKEVTDRLDFNDRMKEIREIIRGKEDVQERIALVQKHLDAGDPSFLHALVLSPDQLIPIDRLNQLRRDYAFQQSPTMQQAESDAIALSQAVKVRTGQLSATMVAILQDKNLEVPISKREYFSYFPTDNPFEKSRQEAMIQKEEFVIQRQQAGREFDEQHAGINLN